MRHARTLTASSGIVVRLLSESAQLALVSLGPAHGVRSLRGRR